MYDIIIVGAGTAGLTAAIYGVRAGKSVLVLEAKTYGGQIINTPKIENYPGIKEISGFEYAKNLYEQAKDLGAKVHFEQVTAIETTESGKLVKTTKDSYECRSVILATGAKNRPLSLPREQELIGAGVSYCATCDGMLYRGKRAAVIGLAADAPAEADFLREIGCDVQYYDGKKHRFEIRGAERADTLVVDGAAQPADVIFVLRAGFAADTLLPGIATEKGHIVVDESYAASIPGVFAAGDCTGSPYQIPAAVGEGNRAALSVVRWLRNA